MNVLMIYENIPDSTDIYLLKDVSEAQLADLCAVHGEYLNATSSKGAEYAAVRISYLIDSGGYNEADREHMCGLAPELVGSWVDSMLTPEQQIIPLAVADLNIDLIVITGMVC